MCLFVLYASCMTDTAPTPAPTDLQNLTSAIVAKANWLVDQYNTRYPGELTADHLAEVKTLLTRITEILSGVTVGLLGEHYPWTDKDYRDILEGLEKQFWDMVAAKRAKIVKQ